MTLLGLGSAVSHYKIGSQWILLKRDDDHIRIEGFLTLRTDDSPKWSDSIS